MRFVFLPINLMSLRRSRQIISSKLKQFRKIFAHFKRNDKEIEVIHSISNQWRVERPLIGDGWRCSNNTLPTGYQMSQNY